MLVKGFFVVKSISYKIIRDLVVQLVSMSEFIMFNIALKIFIAWNIFLSF